MELALPQSLKAPLAMVVTDDGTSIDVTLLQSEKALRPMLFNPSWS